MLFIAEAIEDFDKIITNQKVLCPANENRLFVEITLVQGSPIWVSRSESAASGKGILLVGIGSYYRCDNWLGAISVISERQTRISGEIGYG
ncbi:hypothetical protein [Roseofilum sp. Belize Diploria]|uniref:hypothetical protein n=1 Tax=Roseofilum sp. Belize Diploria TaxID=2821501 RepID=UPI001B25D0AF|nr:hypothetical protein [Roseofilum sp. Belize Diploria]MBP0008050.1 hypothetical protein [Roseofilum sp. Belize Diploria]